MFGVRLLGVLALVALNGFFAATEFSLVAVRLSRVRQLVAKGNARARVVEVLLGDLHRVVSGVQLGITLTSLAIGALGEATFANAFQAIWPGTPGTHSALIAHAAALACAFVLLSVLHVVIGELVPKTISLARAERVALLVARPFQWFLNSFHWAIDLLDGVSGAIVKTLGILSPQAHGVAHSTEELQIQIQQARERGLIAPGEEKFILSAIELAQIQVREIMVPRPGHAHASRGIQPRRSDARICHDAALAHPRISRHAGPYAGLCSHQRHDLDSSRSRAAAGRESSAPAIRPAPGFARNPHRSRKPNPPANFWTNFGPVISVWPLW